MIDPLVPLSVFTAADPSRVPPALLVLEVLDDAAAVTPAALWEANHEFAFRWHPALAAALTDLGATATSPTRFSFTRSRLEARELLELFAGVELDADAPGRSRAERLRNLGAQLGVEMSSSSGRRGGPASLRLSLSLRRVHVDLALEPVSLAGVALGTEPWRCEHRSALEVLAAVSESQRGPSRRRIRCADGSPPSRRFSAVAAFAASTVSFAATVDAPGLASVVVGADVGAAPTYVDGDGPELESPGDMVAPLAELGSRRLVPCVEAEVLAGELEPAAQLFVDERVVDDAFASDPVELDVAGLAPFQSAFVARFVAAPAGVLCALRPGSGKTVCAAAGLAALHGTGDPQALWRALVVAPAATHAQWGAELRRWFAAAEVHVPRSAEALVAAFAASEGRRPAVLVCSPAVMAAAADTLAGDQRGPLLAALVVDEAAWLASRSSKRTAAAWALRRCTSRGLALSGTPGRRGVDDTAALLAWAGGDPQLFSRVPLSSWLDPLAAPAPGFSVADVAGALLFSVDDRLVSTPAGDAPGVVASRVRLDPAAVDAVVSQRCWELLTRGLAEVAAARAAVAGARSAGASTLELRRAATAAQASLSSVLRLSRTCLAAPAEVAASSTLAGFADLDVSNVAGAKLTWLSRFVAGELAGRRMLVFCDAAAAGAAAQDRLVEAGVAATTLPSARAAQRATLDAFDAGLLQVLVVPPAAQLGVNLAAAEVVVHLDVGVSATPAALVQRCARAARVGSSVSEVVSLSPVVAHTIDEVVHDALWAGFVDALSDPVRLGVAASASASAAELVAARPAAAPPSAVSRPC